MKDASEGPRRCSTGLAVLPNGPQRLLSPAGPAARGGHDHPGAASLIALGVCARAGRQGAGRGRSAITHWRTRPGRLRPGQLRPGRLRRGAATGERRRPLQRLLRRLGPESRFTFLPRTPAPSAVVDKGGALQRPTCLRGARDRGRARTHIRGALRTPARTRRACALHARRLHSGVVCVRAPDARARTTAAAVDTRRTRRRAEVKAAGSGQGGAPDADAQGGVLDRAPAPPRPAPCARGRRRLRRAP